MFMSCESLVSIRLNEGLEMIGQYSFANTGLKSVIFPSTLRTVMYGAFYNCRRLQSVEINDGLQYLSVSEDNDEERFGSFEQTAIEQVYLPASLQIIGPKTFRDCRQLRSFVFKIG